MAGVAVAVVQTSGLRWPFTMSDTANAGGDLTLPSLMVSAPDGATLLGRLESGGEGGTWHGVAKAHDHHTSCAVCIQEMMAEELAVKLPCGHHFHEECIRTWLRKQHTCPTCRNPLPPKAAAPPRKSKSSVVTDSSRK